MKIWLVTRITGIYDDRQETPIKAYESKFEAKYHVDVANDFAESLMCKDFVPNASKWDPELEGYFDGPLRYELSEPIEFQYQGLGD